MAVAEATLEGRPRSQPIALSLSLSPLCTAHTATVAPCRPRHAHPLRGAKFNTNKLL